MNKLAELTGYESSNIIMQSPSTISEWITLCILCISMAYLEESFFRFYIISQKDELKLKTTLAVIVSTALFSLCHIHEGLWGFINSAIAGILLAVIFVKYKALHGIAISHSLYNIAAFVINAMELPEKFNF